MSDKKLVIEISGKIDDFKEKMDEAAGEVEGFTEVMNSIAKTSAVVFAGLVAEVGFAVKAFGDSERASKQLELALKGQGIFTDALSEKYKRLAAEVQKKTGIDDDAVVSAQATIQGFIGQQEVTDELTMAIADLSETMGGDLNGAAEKIGKTISTSMNAFKREGLVLSETDTRAEKLTKTLEFLQVKGITGLAVANGNAAGSLRGLSSAFGDVQEEIGSRFAPIISAATNGLIRLLQLFKENEAILNFTVGLIGAGIALSGLGIALPLLVNGFISLQAALAAMNITLSATRIAVIGLASATGIGLLLGAISLLTTYFLSAEEAVAKFKGNLPGAQAEIKKLKEEIAELNRIEAIKGFDANESNANSGPRRKEIADRLAALEELSKVEEDAQKKSNAKNLVISQGIQAEQDRQAKIALEKKKLNAELLAADVAGATQAELDELRKVGELRIAILESQYAPEVAALEAKLAKEREVIAQNNIERENQRLEFDALQEEVNSQGDNGKLARMQTLTDQEIAQLQSSVLTRQGVVNKAYKDELDQQIKSNNQKLIEQQKFGTAYAAINQFMHSAAFQGAKQAFGDLAALTQSSNNTLKSIGKVAAIANIVIQTATSAMNIYAGFSAIPIIGPALGVAGAAAAVAFGAENIGKVQGAAKGGVAKGGSPGRDSIPFMLQDQELVAPPENFEEVIGSVRAGREAQKFGGGTDGEAQLALLASIDQKLSGSDANVGNTYVFQGDMVADDTYIDRLIDRFQDRIDYGNKTLRTT